jgi:NAD(P)-dependent dehydrogenase (short-subunit alcohol dehydrogenase family)
MELNGAVTLVTGANRGIGREFARQLTERGAQVWAAARRPEDIDLPGVRTLRLDITDPASVAAAAELAGNTTLLVNNAGIATNNNLITGDLAEIHREMDTHYFGTLHMVRAFAPVLARNGGGAVLNVLSALSWFVYDGSNAYAAAKAAEWSPTNGIRLELAGQRTMVSALHLGAADTRLTDGYDGAKISAAEVARAALDGLAAGKLEILADDWSAMIKGTLAGDPADFYTAAVRS